MHDDTSEGGAANCQESDQMGMSKPTTEPNSQALKDMPPYEVATDSVATIDIDCCKPRLPSNPRYGSKGSRSFDSGLSG